MPALHHFDADTALEPVGGSSYRGEVPARWWIVRGPNGGFMAAVILRAMLEAAAGARVPAQDPCSLTIHYLRPPAKGPFDIAVTVEREGRTLTSLSARMSQAGKLVALALGALSTPREGNEYNDTVMPEVKDPEAQERIARAAGAPPVVDNYDMRPAREPPPRLDSEGPQAETSAWLRLADPREHDALAVAAYCDALLPPPFVRLDRVAAAPTIDLTIHFRAPLPAAAPAPDRHCLAVARAGLSRGGFFAEDCDIWAPDGTLLAQARQLALLVG